jgi:hypothetical protein
MRATVSDGWSLAYLRRRAEAEAVALVALRLRPDLDSHTPVAARTAPAGDETSRW